MNEATIVLLTDFGNQDAYVGIMKGVMREIAPQAALIDLTHDIPQGDVRLAAYRLWQAVPYFPEGTVFVVVVDPGVGTARRPVAAAWKGVRIVGPDNGLFTFVDMQEEPEIIVALQQAAYHRKTVSHTFHGRDIFAPAGAYIAAGASLDTFGPTLDTLHRFPHPRLEWTAIGLRGEILFADHFGNLITNLGILSVDQRQLLFDPWLPGAEPLQRPFATARVILPRDQSLSLSRTFGVVETGEPLAYIGSDGMLEIAVRDGHAAQQLGLNRGDPILLAWEK